MSRILCFTVKTLRFSACFLTWCPFQMCLCLIMSLLLDLKHFILKILQVSYYQSFDRTMKVQNSSCLTLLARDCVKVSKYHNISLLLQTTTTLLKYFSCEHNWSMWGMKVNFTQLHAMQRCALRAIKPICKEKEACLTSCID